MQLTLSVEEAAAVAAAAHQERRVRVWRRYRAIQLLAVGQTPTAIAAALGCSLASIYNWVAAWREHGLAGLQEGPHPGKPPLLHGAPAQRLEALLATDPAQTGYHATGWTVPLLQAELATAGVMVSQRTIRRTIRRLGWSWKRPKYVLGRPDPAYEEKRGQSWSGSKLY